MHLWDFKGAGIQIWDFWMLKMSDIGNHSESQVQFEVQIEKAHLPVNCGKVMCLALKVTLNLD